MLGFGVFGRQLNKDLFLSTYINMRYKFYSLYYLARQDFRNVIFSVNSKESICLSIYLSKAKVVM